MRRSKTPRPAPFAFQPLESRQMLSISTSFANQFKSSGDINPVATVVDSNGNVYVTGTFTGVADFDLGTATSNLDAANGGAFLVRYDSSGALAWARQFGKGTGGNAVPTHIALDASRLPVVVGTFSGTDVDLNPESGTTKNFSATGADDVFMLKRGAVGGTWSINAFHVSAEDAVVGLSVDKSNNLYIAGNTNNGVDSDSGFVAKFSSTFRFRFLQRFANGATKDVALTALTGDANGNLVLAGTSEAAGLDVNPGAGTVTVGASNFLLRLDAAGQYKSVNTFSATAIKFSQLAVDNAGDVYAAGTFSNTVDVNPSSRRTFTLASEGSTDTFVAKFIGGTTLAWARTIGGSGAEKTDGLAIDPKTNEILVSGRFQGRVYFNLGVSRYRGNSLGGDDVFVARYGSKKGGFIEAGKIGNADNDRAARIATGPGRAVYLFGVIAGSAAVDFDPGAAVKSLTNVSSPSTDGYLVKWVLA